jgi:hypothetical protein
MSTKQKALKRPAPEESEALQKPPRFSVLDLTFVDQERPTYPDFSRITENKINFENVAEAPENYAFFVKYLTSNLSNAPLTMSSILRKIARSDPNQLEKVCARLLMGRAPKLQEISSDEFERALKRKGDADIEATIAPFQQNVEITIQILKCFGDTIDAAECLHGRALNAPQQSAYLPVEGRNMSLERPIVVEYEAEPSIQGHFYKLTNDSSTAVWQGVCAHLNYTPEPEMVHITDLFYQSLTISPRKNATKIQAHTKELRDPSDKNERGFALVSDIIIYCNSDKYAMKMYVDALYVTQPAI